MRSIFIVMEPTLHCDHQTKNLPCYHEQALCAGLWETVRLWRAHVCGREWVCGHEWVCAGCGCPLESSSTTFHVTQPTGRVSQLMKPLFWSSLGGQFVLVISPMSLPSKGWVIGHSTSIWVLRILLWVLTLQHFCLSPLLNLVQYFLFLRLHNSS